MLSPMGECSGRTRFLAAHTAVAPSSCPCQSPLPLSDPVLLPAHPGPAALPPHPGVLDRAGMCGLHRNYPGHCGQGTLSWEDGMGSWAGRKAAFGRGPGGQVRDWDCRAMTLWVCARSRSGLCPSPQPHSHRLVIPAPALALPHPAPRRHSPLARSPIHLPGQACPACGGPGPVSTGTAPACSSNLSCREFL